MNTPFASDAAFSGPSDGAAAGPYDEISRVLADVPRPRPVRMGRRGRVVALIVSIAILTSFGLYVVVGTSAGRKPPPNYAGPSQLPMFGVSIAITVAFAIFAVTTIGTQKSLVSDGEMAVARVTKRWAARNGPNIAYEFTTPLGERVARIAADGSRKLAVGMNVPVFYDPRNPKRQLALCASFYEVVLPGKNPG